MTVEELVLHIKKTDEACENFLAKYEPAKTEEIPVKALDPILSLLGTIAGVGHEQCQHQKVLTVLKTNAGGRRLIVGVSSCGELVTASFPSFVPDVILEQIAPVFSNGIPNELSAKEIIKGVRSVLHEMHIEGIATQPAAQA